MVIEIFQGVADRGADSPVLRLLLGCVQPQLAWILRFQTICEAWFSVLIILYFYT